MAQQVHLPAGSHVVVVHRRQDDLARYREYIDHTAHRITYAVTERSRPYVPADLASPASPLGRAVLAQVAGTSGQGSSSGGR